MKVFITGLRELALGHREYFETFKALAINNPGAHQIVDSEKEADIILLVYGVEHPFYLRPFEAAMIQQRADDIFIFNAIDSPITYLPGVYANLTKSIYNKGRNRQFCFPFINHYLEDIYKANHKKEYLFSFAGGSTSWLRKKIYKINYRRSDVYIQDTSSHQEWNPQQSNWAENKIRFGEILAKSHFVLCPRGASVSAGRFFEAMQVGRVPVIISDGFVYPEGVDWKRCSLSFPESAILKLPKLIEPYLKYSESMGALAREEWVRNFRPEVWFEQIINNIVLIKNERKNSEKIFQKVWPVLKLKNDIKNQFKKQTKSVFFKFMQAVRLKSVVKWNRPS